MVIDVAVLAGDLSQESHCNQVNAKEKGDHCGFAYRVSVENYLIPIPFVRARDAELAARATVAAVVENKVPADWQGLKKLMTESLMW